MSWSSSFFPPEAEKTHVFWRTSASVTSGGKLPICIEDIRVHADSLEPVLLQLAGRQPSAIAYSQAMHALDKASSLHELPKRTATSFGHALGVRIARTGGDADIDGYQHHTCAALSMPTLSPMWALWKRECLCVQGLSLSCLGGCSLEASEWKLSGVKPKHDTGMSEWAALEGTAVHCIVAYLHKLTRNSTKSHDKTIMMLKALCPSPGDPVTRKRKSPSDDRCDTQSACEEHALYV
jgi:hypothetical protein